MTDLSAEAEFKVIKGEPSAEELAAIVVALKQLATTEKLNSRIKPEWNAAHRNVRWHFEHGPAMWRRSALPHK